MTPGRYRIVANVPAGGRPSEWFLASATADGHEILDNGLDLQPTRPPGELVLTFTDNPSSLTGVVTDSSGMPAPDYHIIAFPPDRALWARFSRRIQSVRPSADGRYTFRYLPPGDYLVAAVDDVEPGEWFDPVFLQTLVDSSIKVSIGESEQKTQDLRLAASR